jgi:hypothetical protein
MDSQSKKGRGVQMYRQYSTVEFRSSNPQDHSMGGEVGRSLGKENFV